MKTAHQVPLLALLLAACSPQPPTAAEVAAASQRPASGAAWQNGSKLTVMTRNVYLGADVNRIAAATKPEEIPAAVGALWATVQMTDFPARAKLIADEIEQAAPDLLALEELSLYRTGPGLSCLDPTAQATTVAIDFLALLRAELAARGLRYDVASIVDNFDQTLCAFDGGSFLDVRLTDRDAILARHGLQIASPRSGNFAARALFPAGGATVPVLRGWNSVEAKIHGRWIRFLQTHLEVESFAPVQEAQAKELAAIATAGAPERVILSGDLNSGPQLADVTTSYADLLAAGFRDPWTRLHRRDPGLTCCFDELLLTGALTTRIDHNLYEGALQPIWSWRVGLEDRTASGLHASDHAGVVAVFQLTGRVGHEGAVARSVEATADSP